MVNNTFFKEFNLKEGIGNTGKTVKKDSSSCGTKLKANSNDF